MKKIILISASLAVLAGCSFAARSSEMYRDDTKAILDTKGADIQACYDQVLKATPGAQGTVTVLFDVETEEGKIVNVTTDSASTTAPAPVAECVTTNIAGLQLAPPDKRTGKATFVYEFTAPPAPAAAAPTTPALPAMGHTS